MRMLVNDIAAFTNVLGVTEPDLVWYLANVEWESDSERNAFIDEIAKFQGPVEA